MDMTQASKTKRAILGRRACERLDLLLLVIEALDLNSSEAMLFTSHKLGFQALFPNRVELWKRRCYNPLRKTTRRGNLSEVDAEALIKLLCSMADRLYPVLRQLLSKKEPKALNDERWNLFGTRLNELIQERMNLRRGAVQRLLSKEDMNSFHYELIFTLALAAGPGGVDRLRASLLDPFS